MPSHTPSAIPVEQISRSIRALRGERVILDRDLAAIYGVPTRVLNQAVKRNRERFPEDFVVRLTPEDTESLRSQLVILKKGRGQHAKYAPLAFTEHGAIQAANVLNSRRAIAMGVYVVRAFVQLRRALMTNQEVTQKLTELERKLHGHDRAILEMLRAIRTLTDAPQPRRRSIGFTADLDR